MVVGATIGAALILLVVLAEALGGFLWQDDAAAVHRCPTCDLKYTRYEVGGRRAKLCPRGHALARGASFSWTLALTTACATVVMVGLIRMATGRA